MTTDVCIHIVPDDMTDEEVRSFFRNHLGSSLSAYAKVWEYSESIGQNAFENPSDEQAVIIDKLWEDAHNDNERLIKIAEENNVYHRLYTSEHLLVGETGWKRDLTEEEQEQDLLVNFMTNFMDELTIIGDEMVETVDELYSLPVLTREQVVEKSKMLEFLKRNKGKRSITIPW